MSDLRTANVISIEFSCLLKLSIDFSYSDFCESI